MIAELFGLVAFIVVPLIGCAWLAGAYFLENRSDRIPILLYHRLIRKADADSGKIADREAVWVSYDTVFSDQMDLLKREGYTTLSLDDYLRIREGSSLPPRKPVIVTFDDGYESNYSLAFSALRRNGQKATIFVALEPDEHTRKLVEGADGFLSAEQMREMAEDGISIESHSLTHPILTDLTPEAVEFELSESKRRLAAITGRPVLHLAIPRAGYNRQIRKQAIALGYKTVCCNNKGTANGWSDPFALPRIVVERDMSAESLLHALSPRGGLELRVVGNIKRIPERIGGVQFAQRVRRLLYRGPHGGLFTARNLKYAAGIAGAAYLGGGILYIWRLLST